MFKSLSLKTNLYFVLGWFVSENVDGLVLGVDNMKQIEENVELFKSAALTEEQRNEISQAFSIDNVLSLDPGKMAEEIVLS